jgi:hypothetical protein
MGYEISVRELVEGAVCEYNPGGRLRMENYLNSFLDGKIDHLVEDVRKVINDHLDGRGRLVEISEDQVSGLIKECCDLDKARRA